MGAAVGGLAVRGATVAARGAPTASRAERVAASAAAAERRMGASGSQWMRSSHGIYRRVQDVQSEMIEIEAANLTGSSWLERGMQESQDTALSIAAERGSMASLNERVAAMGNAGTKRGLNSGVPSRAETTGGYGSFEPVGDWGVGSEYAERTTTSAISSATDASTLESRPLIEGGVGSAPRPGSRTAIGRAIYRYERRNQIGARVARISEPFLTDPTIVKFELTPLRNYLTNNLMKAQAAENAARAAEGRSINIVGTDREAVTREAKTAIARLKIRVQQGRVLGIMPWGSLVRDTETATAIDPFTITDADLDEAARGGGIVEDKVRRATLIERLEYIQSDEYWDTIHHLHYEPHDTIKHLAYHDNEGLPTADSEPDVHEEEDMEALAADAFSSAKSSSGAGGDSPHPFVAMATIASTGRLPSLTPQPPIVNKHDKFGNVADRDRLQADLGLEDEDDQAYTLPNMNASTTDANPPKLPPLSQNSEVHPAMGAGDQGYTQVDTLPGGGDYPDWARGMWYKGYAHRYIPDTGVYTPGKLLPRSAGSQANEALLVGVAGLAVAALSRVLVRV